MCTPLSEIHKSLISDVAAKENLTNYSIFSEPGAIKGDNYMGILVTIKVESKDNEIKTLHLMLKKAQEDDKLRKENPVRLAYLREIKIYQQVFPEFSNFEKEFSVSKCFNSYPKVFGTLTTEKSECLVMENLKQAGFKLWNRTKPMNSDHVTLVFREYGRFHAFSLAMKKLQSSKFQALVKDLDMYFTKSMDQDKLAEVTHSNFMKAFKAVESSSKATNGLKRFYSTIGVFFKSTVPSTNKYSVITHGDCWCNNMMFQYKDFSDPGKPTDLKFIDFQLSSYGSPVLDLSYFFYACSSKSIMDNLASYLRQYHESLAQTLGYFHLNVEDIFPFRELINQWKIYGKYGLYMSILVLKVMLNDGQDIPDLTQQAQQGKNLIQAIDSQAANAEYSKRLKDVIVSLVDHHYL